MGNFQTVMNKLGGLRRRLLMIFLSWGIAIWLVVLLVLALNAYALDTFLHLPLWMRAVYNVGSGIVLLLVLMRYVVYPLTRKPSTEELALMVEHEFPVLNDRLITSLQMAQERNRYAEYGSRELIDRTIDEGLEAASKLNFVESLRTGSVVWATGIAVALIGLFAAIIYVAPQTAQIWRDRMLLGSAEYPARYAVTFSVPVPQQRMISVRGRGGDQNVPINYGEWRGGRMPVGIGSSLVIEANVFESGNYDATNADLPTPTIHMINRVSGIEEEAEMLALYDESASPVTGRFFFVIKSVSSGLDQIWIEAGDGRSEVLEIDAQEPPVEEMLAAEVQLPSYIPKTNEIYDNSQLGYGFKATADSTVKITTAIDQEMAAGYPKVWFKNSAGLALDDPDAEANRIFGLEKDGNRYSKEFSVQSDYVGFELILKTLDGIINIERPTHRIEIVRDTKATSSLHAFGPGLRSSYEIPVVFDAKVPLVYSTSDNIEIGSRVLSFTPPQSDEPKSDPKGDKVPETPKDLELSAFLQAYASRDQALATLLSFRDRSALSIGADDLSTLREAFAKVKEINGIMRPVQWQESANEYLGTEQLAAWLELESTFAVIRNGPESNEAMRNFVNALERYATASQRDSTDRYVLDVSEILRGIESVSTREKIEERYALKGNQPFRVTVRVAAFDKAPLHEKSFEDADEVTYLVGPRRFVAAEIASRISNRFMRTLGATRRAQERLVDSTNKILDNHPSASALTEDELETLRQTREEQSYLRRDLAQLEEHARLVAQTYQINQLALVHSGGRTTIDNNTQTQERNIARVRLLLAMISAEPTDQLSMENNRIAFVETENPDEALVEELHLAFRLTREGYRLGDQMSASNIKAFFGETEDLGNCIFENINAAYARFFNASPDDLVTRYQALNDIRSGQGEMKRALDEINTLLQKWQSIDRIRENLEIIQQELDRLQKDIFNAAKGNEEKEGD
ncbi:MAG: hypothetical protein KDB07_03115 [Planctomycetes bacterium]|nr:hypothetical protein [Planctomycetota bacterium]